VLLHVLFRHNRTLPLQHPAAASLKRESLLLVLLLLPGTCCLHPTRHRVDERIPISSYWPRETPPPPSPLLLPLPMLLLLLVTPAL
jgi:hypothetical protein